MFSKPSCDWCTGCNFETQQKNKIFYPPLSVFCGHTAAISRISVNRPFLFSFETATRQKHRSLGTRQEKATTRCLVGNLAR